MKREPVMAIGWMVRIEIRGDGNKDSMRGYAVAIRNSDEAIAAAREASGERGAEIDEEITREMFDDLNLKPGEVRCIFEGNNGLTWKH
jgi:hypothetical protein